MKADIREDGQLWLFPETSTETVAVMAMVLHGHGAVATAQRPSDGRAGFVLLIVNDPGTSPDGQVGMEELDP